MGRCCAYCGSGKLTGEHLLMPAWLVEEHRQTYQGSQVFRASRQGWHADLDTKVREVCGTCNQGRLSDLDAKAKGTLSGIFTTSMSEGGVVLDHVDVEFARWAAKCFVNFALANKLQFPCELARFIMRTGPTRWNDLPFRILVSFGHVFADGRPLTSFHFRTEMQGDLEYRNVTVGPLHFHLIFRSQEHAAEDELDHAGATIEDARCAARLPVVDGERRLMLRKEDPIVRVGTGISHVPKDETFAVFEKEIEVAFGLHVPK